MTNIDIDETVAGREGHSLTDYLETIALLQEEIARLEEELLLHTERASETMASGVASALDELAPSAASESALAAQAEVERLQCEVAKGEETVALLLDQLGLLEESSAAARAEWDRLTEWVAELEKRVEGQDEDAVRRVQARLAVKEREADELRSKTEQDRRGWELEREVYNAKITRLEAGLAQAQACPPAAGDDDQRADSGPHPDALVVQALQEENLRLREWQEVVERTAAENSGSLRSWLGELQNERDELKHQLEQLEDTRKREGLEHQAALAELRTRLSQASLVQPKAPQPNQERERPVRDLDSDQRIRALRQHLLEIHQREEEDRRQRSLAGRLSRLWNRTSPR